MAEGLPDAHMPEADAVRPVDREQHQQIEPRVDAEVNVSKRPRNIESVVQNYIDPKVAQSTKVVRFPNLLSDADLEEVLRYHAVALSAADPMEANPQNKEHKRKRCTFLHGATAPNGGLLGQAPRVLAKMVRAALSAKEIGGWGSRPNTAGSEQLGGPLADIDFRRLSIRVVELWEYEPGGGLVDDSITMLVA
eukprot:TRINITY_DN77473_c0_g1_i1.p1 TRINITY_DN77473_c0_g1~~TRINITY_DN77473_c0_g1_i1.p1  ORF type:complete len:213 (+),score=27.28 TRINITY_DN77473_c0_g1_i1:62-640(+)